jgi:hypothetical protein
MVADGMGIRHVRHINGVNRVILPEREGTSGNIDEVWSLGCNPVETLYHVLAGAIGHPGLGESGIRNGRL